MPKESIDVNVDDEDIEIHFHRKKRPPKPKFLFYYRGIGIKDMKKPDSIDTLNEISKFTKSELLLLNITNEKLEGDTLQMTIVKKDYSQADQQKLTLAIKSWIQKGFIKRIRREHYMINPYFITPNVGRHEILMDAWNYLP